MLERISHYDYSRGIRIECYTDGYAYNEYSELYLLSVVGYDSAVKGMTAAVLSSKEIEILSGDCAVSLYTSRHEKYRVFGSKLASGLLHEIVAAESFFTREGMAKVLYVGEEQSIEEVVYRKLEQMYAVPALPEWAGWIYEKLAGYGCVEELKGTAKVFRLDVHEKQLDELISEGVKNREVCFEERRIGDVGRNQQCDGLSEGLWRTAC